MPIKSRLRVIIAGGRFFNDYKKVCEVCDHAFSNLPDVVIVSGTCKGADKLGERYAIEKGYTIDPYPANWDSYGKRAGFIRNTQMSENADALIAFWDGKSKGTKHMIDIAKRKGLRTRIILY